MAGATVPGRPLPEGTPGARAAGVLRTPLAALAIFVLLAVIHLWPMPAHPAHLGRTDNGDDELLSWAVAWVAHELPRHPLHVFDGNIFYPERLTLAYSEAMLLQGAAAIPIFAAGGSPVLAYNLLLLAGFALTGWAFWLLVHAWTGSTAAAYVAGSLAAFNSHVLVRLPHLQTQHVEFVALMLFAVDRLATGRRTRDALLLGLGFALQGLTSLYLLVFSTWAMIFAVAARARDWLRGNRVAAVLRLALAGAVGVAILSPYLLAYYRLHQLTGLERGVGDQLAGSWVDYLATGSRLHFALWSHRFFSQAHSDTFPGVIATALVGLAAAWPETRRNPRVRMCAVVAIGCAIVSFLPHAPGYPVLHAAIPLFRAVRVPAHLGQFVLLMIAVLAGFGVAGWERRWRRAGSWAIVAAALVVGVNVEALRAPLGWQPFAGIPAVYDALAAEPGAVVIELPFPPRRQFFINADYMLNSTRHWRPLLNGYSGFVPASYDPAFEAADPFPADRSLVALHALGVTDVVVHERAFVEHYGRERFDGIARASALQPIAADDDIHIYRLYRP